MRRFITIAILLLATAGLAEDSPLVKAAKESTGPKKATKKTITNADVKKSSVKSSASSTAPKAASPPSGASAPTPATPPVVMPTSAADQDKLYRGRTEAQKRVDVEQSKVADLEKELDRLEQAYYAENDPNYRDKTIAGRFEQTKLQLESARKELAEARDALETLKPK